MKWVLIFLIFNGSSPAVVQEEFGLLSDCLGADLAIRLAIEKKYKPPYPEVVGVCVQKTEVK
jgi:hypothetical protein